MRIRKLALATVAASCAVALTACGGSASQDGESKEITVLGYSGIFEDKYTETVIKKFEEQNDGYKVKFAPAQNSAEMLGKLRSEKSKPTVDLALIDASVANTGDKEGLFDKFDEDAIPNAKNVVDLGKNKDGYGPAVTFDNLTVLYNTEKVSKAPKGTGDLWNAPDSSVAIPAPPDIQGLALTVLTANDLKTDYKKDVSPAIKKLSELKPKVNTWEPQPDVYQTVISGQAQYAIGWNARSQYYAGDSDGKLGVTQPANGLAFQINTINLVKDSPASEAAKKFADYALSAEAQVDFAKTMFYSPTVKDAKLPDELRGKVSDANDPRSVKVDWIWMADNRDGWTDQWRREVIGK